MRASRAPACPPSGSGTAPADARSAATVAEVFGGNRTDFIQHYASQAIRLIETRGNQPAWQKFPNKDWHNHLFEQYLLSACIEYHSSRADSPFRDIAMSYVFASMEEAFNQNAATRVGYTHLIADAKRNPQLADRVEARVAKDHPAHYRRCLDYLQRQDRQG